MDTTNNTLLAIEADSGDHVNYLNSFNMATGQETHVMDVSPVAMVSGDGYTYDDRNRVLYTLTLDWDPTPSRTGYVDRILSTGYRNILNIINIKGKTIKRMNISCEYKLVAIHYDPTDGNIYAFEYKSGWMSSQNINDQPQNQTVYVGKINLETQTFERLVSVVVPFYSSDEFITAYSPMRGYYVIAWPEPDYDPYITKMNGVLQVIDVRNATVLYNSQVKGWNMRDKTSSLWIIIDMHFSD